MCPALSPALPSPHTRPDPGPKAQDESARSAPPRGRAQRALSGTRRVRPHRVHWGLAQEAPSVGTPGRRGYTDGGVGTETRRARPPSGFGGAPPSRDQRPLIGRALQPPQARRPLGGPRVFTPEYSLQDLPKTAGPPGTDAPAAGRPSARPTFRERPDGPRGHRWSRGGPGPTSRAPVPRGWEEQEPRVPVSPGRLATGPSPGRRSGRQGVP